MFDLAFEILTAYSNVNLMNKNKNHKLLNKIIFISKCNFTTDSQSYSYIQILHGFANKAFFFIYIRRLINKHT